MLVKILERGMKMQKHMYLCFINSAKAFYKLRRKEMLELLNKLYIFAAKVL